MDEEVISSPVSYPDDETLARSESFAELGVEATQTMNDLWLSVKTSTANTTTYLILTLVAIAAVAAFFIISGIVKRRKKERVNGSYMKAFAAFVVDKKKYVLVLYVLLIAAGIVDPTKVTRSALQNAASIAATLLTTESLVADKPQPAAPAAPAPDMGGMGGMY